ncbi:MAG: acyl transferase [Flavobacteriaceae bacterium]|nr:acyl transferase [Flavobacteriaceae bacterium]MBT7984359.1 acyl transferase [Flavobacteriaceae bacterium]
MKFEKNKLFKLNSTYNFNQKAIEIFNFQYNNNSVYSQYCKLINVNAKSIKKIKDIPFLPIQFFKNYTVSSYNKHTHSFKSSGTGGKRSVHHIKDINIYIESFTQCFEENFGSINNTVFLGLLPSYIEQGNSSLIYMVDYLIQKSNRKESGFYLNDYKKLYDLILKLEKSEKKIILIGVSYALLDFIDNFSLKTKNLVIIETGGMKGRRKEITREELHDKLKRGFNSNNIKSEYGMTELLSQAYSNTNGIFKSPPWLKILVREINDPLYVKSHGKGALNFIDLANVNSCSFIASDDIGEVYRDSSFKVLGRLSNSEIRGCNLMFN